MSQNRSIQRRCLREIHRRADRARLGDERRISKVADHPQIRCTSPRPHRVSSLWPRRFIPVSTYRCARTWQSASAVSIGTGRYDEDQTIAPCLIDGLRLTTVWRI